MNTYLDLGCGQDKKEGYLGLDIHPWPCVDVVHDATTGLPFPDNHFDKVYSGMFFEHLGKFQVPPMLRECHRVLREGGELRIIVPDLDKVLADFLKAPLGDKYHFPLDTVFGGQAHEGEFHKTGFWPELCSTLFARAGLSYVKIREIRAYAQPSLEVTGYK